MKSRTTLTISDIEKKLAAGTIRGYKVMNEPKEEDKPKKSKYGNVRCEVDGIKFMSTGEAKRYIDLRNLQKDGQISELKLQVCYELNPGGTHSYKYIADFVYMEDGVLIVEDYKGERTETYKKKARIMLKVHGITIRETGSKSKPKKKKK